MSTVKKLISLDTAVANELEAVAKALNVTQREVIEQALDFYFDYTDSIVAKKISDDVRSGKEPVYDAGEVFKTLGL